MATICIDNFTPGSNTSPYDTWAKAALLWTSADAVDAAGDTIYLDHRHSESTAGGVTINVAGTPTTPSKVLSVTQSGSSGASAVTAGATIATTGTNSITVNGSFYAYGLTLNNGSGTGLVAGTYATAADNTQVWESCTFTLGTTGATSKTQFLPASAGNEGCVTLRNCTFIFGATGQGITAKHGKLEIIGGSIGATSAAITTGFIASTLDTGLVKVTGFDFTHAGATLNLVAGGLNGGVYIFRNCLLPASWSGALVSSAPTNPGFRAEMHDCDSGATNYRTQAYDYAGSQVMETTIVRSGGASDGTTPVSWKVVSTANAEYPTVPYQTIEIAQWVDTTGASKTATIEFVHDSLTALNNNEIWMELVYMGSTTSPLATIANDAVANVITAAAAQPTSTATWTTTGITNPNKQKLQITFTPQQKGYIVARVYLAKPSYTVYVDPLITVA